RNLARFLSVGLVAHAQPQTLGRPYHGRLPMKISVDVDCTPEEARRFFGLPDLEPMHTALMAEVQDRLTSGLRSMDPEALMRTWLPSGMQGFDQMQKFWSEFAAAGKPASGKKEGSS